MKIQHLKILVNIAALAVLGLCVYAFLLSSEVFTGKLKSEPFGTYFLAKGIFCSFSLHLSVRILEALSREEKE